MKKWIVQTALAAAALAGLWSCQGPQSPANPNPSTSGNVKVVILDSLGGSPVDPSVGLSLKVETADASAKTVNLSQNPQALTLTPGQVYTLTASARGRASDRHELVTVEDGAVLAFYSHDLEQSTFEAKAPIIESLEYLLAPTKARGMRGTWTVLDSGSTVDLASLMAARFTLRSWAQVDATSWSGPGILVDIDQVPGTFSGFSPDYQTTYDEATSTFVTEASVDLVDLNLTPGTHSFEIVAYDRSGNRVHRSFPFEVEATGYTDAYPLGPGNLSPLAVEFRTYGVTRNYYGAAQALTSTSAGTTRRAHLTFEAFDGETGDPIPLLGFQVERAEDDGSFLPIGQVSYGSPSTAAAGTHEYWDLGAGLADGHTYRYRVLAKTDEVHAAYTACPVAASLLPAFTASLTSPPNKSLRSAESGLPNLKFKVSNPGVLVPSVADYFYFAPLIRERSGEILFYSEFRVDLVTEAVELSSPSGWVPLGDLSHDTLVNFDRSTGEVTVSPNLLLAEYNWLGAAPDLKPGATYEWDVFGRALDNDLGSAPSMWPMFLLQDRGSALSLSFADAYQNGNQTLNGWFTFTAN